LKWFSRAVILGATTLTLCTAGDVLATEDTSSIRFLIEPQGEQSEVKKNAIKKYSKAIEIIDRHSKEKQVSIVPDLDSELYQSYIKQFGGAIGFFSEEETNEIIEFVKFMDLYENYDQNKKIKYYKDKKDKGEELTYAENMEMQSLIPSDPSEPETSYDEPSYVQAEDPPSGEAPTEAEAINYAAAANGYDKYKARDYARTWTTNDGRLLRNNSVYPYYSNYNNCTSCWNDCTNFVSQAIKAGGLRHQVDNYAGDAYNWYYNNTRPSNTWGGAHNFYNHMKYRAGVASSSSYLTTGDVVNADFSKDGHIDHTAIITYHSSSTGYKWLTQHTSDMEEKTHLSTWFSKGYKVYGYELDKADN
jgi:Putative amidase domain